MTLSKRSRDLFEAARGEGRPSDVDRERVRRRLDKRLAAAGAAATVGAVATKTAASATGLGGAATGTGIAVGSLAKLVVPIVLLSAAATAAGVTLSGRDRADPAASTARASTRSLSAESARPPTQLAPVQAATPEPPASASSQSQRATANSTRALPAPTAARGPGEPASELALIEAMNAALARGDAATTLGLASEHARLYPAGSLAQERDGARALALCMVGTSQPAREFVQAHPTSPLVGRLRAVCESHADSFMDPTSAGQ